MKTIYPYLYTRGAVMKRNLLGKEQYARLLKMDLLEIIKFLEESEYRKWIDDLALTLKGVDLAEAAINLGLADFLSRIRRMADKETKKLLDSYLERWDVYNAKTILRLIGSKSTVKYPENLLIAGGSLPKEFFLDALKSGNSEELIRKLPILSEQKKQEIIQSLAQGGSLLEVESALDRNYYGKMGRISKQAAQIDAKIARFLRDEVSIINLKTVMRLKQEGVDSQKARQYLIAKGGKQENDLLALLASQSVESLIETAQKGSYGKFLEGLDAPTLFEAELACERYLILRYASSSYMNPNSITPLFTILFIKSAEAQNLKGLIKARQLGLENSFIENKVVQKCWR